jgi:hypothetical protein
MYPQFTELVDGRVVLVPCVAFVIFPYQAGDAGLLDFYQRSREALGERITHYQAESMKRFAPVNARSNAMVPTWLAQPLRGKTSYYMILSDGDPDEAVTASRIELHIDRRVWGPEEETRELDKRRKAFDARRFVPLAPVSELRVTLPLDHPLAEPARLREWILGFSLLQDRPAFSAYAGYALNYYNQAAISNLHGPAERLLASACLRHPGFDWSGGAVLPRIMRFMSEPPGYMPLVKRAAWLNLVCDRTLGLLGGRDGLRKRFANEPAIGMQDLPHGLAIQAGAAPEIGDVGHRDFVPLLRRVASEIRPVRVEAIASAGRGFGREATNDWLNAFDKAYD